MLLFAITFTWRIMKEAKDQRYRIRSFVGGSIGNLVEWYDWYAYSFFSIYFAPVFFPKADKAAQLLNAACVFAVGFFMWPIGGWLFGKLADKQGRKKVMTVSVLLMSFGSLLIACTPGYETVGLVAPVILFTARLIQGLSVGGEYGTSATYLSEMATPERRGFYSSFQYVTLIAGQLVAVALQLSPCQVNGQSYLKIQMSRYCSVYAPYMSRLFKDAGHMRDICGTYAGHPILCHRVSISHTKAFHLSVITCRHKGIRCRAALCTNERCLWRYRRIPWGLV